MMMKLLEKLGQNPQRSLTIFLRGLGLFAIGAVFIGLGVIYHHAWQVVGIIVIAIACIIAGWGYVGIFSHRWWNIMYRNKNLASRAKNEFDH